MAGSEHRRPHAVLVPFPAQGHINPMMQLANKLVEQGFVITFVSTDYNYSRIAKANKSIEKDSAVSREGNSHGDIRWIVVSDGLPPTDTRADVIKLCHVTENIIVSFIDKLIGEMKRRDPEEDICLITDCFAATALDVAKRHRIPMAALWVMFTATYALIYNLPNLVSSSLVPSNGVPNDFTKVKYLPSMPPLCSAHLPWAAGFNENQQDFIFGFIERYMERTRELKWVLFNSFYYLEAPIIDILIAQGASVCSIGPCIPSPRLNGEVNSKITANFWAEEAECLDWLDKQSPKSVAYVSFGSLAIVNQRQLEEFAMGMEATQRPFLWVLRSDLMDGSSAKLPPGFMEATKDRAYFVPWCPQTQVLSHPSIACFFTHCGWNSVMESIAMGVPMLCWPYFAEHFLISAYVVDIWKIGLALNTNIDGIAENREIEMGVKRVSEDNEMKARVLKLSERAKDAVKSETGPSYANFQDFVKAMREEIRHK
ncbi:hypothetical protein SUGI_1023210 [Cryptomeria japonica]|uniref:7-deoxyloganetin glucosyltransferase-like n=1 Tax=Cryptomeria japonica TaxID=3369 RepID=UPI002414AF19|nr:7-deoxyloganetin glucosyltransferase-like [Cryptomeria japonica]GLJ48473.1 hypothetical protein SUGI_1023210 [Cryptomeria japonica]